MVDKIPAVILVGGKGTRLRPLTLSTPKCLVDVNGKPLLYRVIKELKLDDLCSEIILSAGYMSEQVIEYVNTCYDEYNCKLSVIRELTPLDTGGATENVMNSFNLNEFLLVNGDTLLKADISNLLNKSGTVVIGTVQVDDNSRYGTVISDNDIVVEFLEKSTKYSGTPINAGIYKINPNIFQFAPSDTNTYSLEKYLLPELIKLGIKIKSVKLNAEYFNDIADVEALSEANIYYNK